MHNHAQHVTEPHAACDSGTQQGKVVDEASRKLEVAPLSPPLPVLPPWHTTFPARLALAFQEPEASCVGGGITHDELLFNYTLSRARLHAHTPKLFYTHTYTTHDAGAGYKAAALDARLADHITALLRLTPARMGLLPWPSSTLRGPRAAAQS